MNVRNRDFKSDGWQWQRTRLKDASRAERHWLAMAVATLWMVSQGTDVGDSAINRLSPKENQLGSPVFETKLTIFPTKPYISCFLKGLMTILADLLNGQPIRLKMLTDVPIFSLFNYNTC